MTETVLVPLYQDGELCTYALIDAADADAISRYKWLRLGGYALAGARLDWTAPRLDAMAMHRFLLGLKRNDGKVTHHINEDPLDNRRENLQVFDNAIEANCQPHPRRDLWRRKHLPPHYRERLIAEREAAA